MYMVSLSKGLTKRRKLRKRNEEYHVRNISFVTIAGTTENKNKCDIGLSANPILGTH